MSENAGTRLKPNVIGPWGLAALAIGITSPAMGLYALWAPMQVAAGPITPLVFLAAMFVILPTAISYAALNRHVPSAGAASTWLAMTLGPFAGHLAGLVMLGYFIMVSISQPLLFALFFRDFLDYLGVPASALQALVAGILVEVAVVGWICFRGAEASIRTTVKLMIAETAVVLAMSATILLAKAGEPGGISLAPLDPSSATGLGGFWSAMILGVLAFCGFDVVSTAAEEAKAPSEYVPRAIIYTVTGVALFWAANAYVLTLAAPHADVVRYSAEGLTAITPIARTYWGVGNLMIILTAFTGLIAVYISCVQGASRILFALARQGQMPAMFSRLTGHARAPRHAVVAVVMLCVLFGFSSLAIFPDGLTAFVWWSNALVFFAILTFTGVNLANLIYFRRAGREHLQILSNLVAPMIGILANIYLLYEAFFASLWTQPLATGKSVVMAALALLIALVGWTMFSTGRKPPAARPDEADAHGRS